jgi:hypothetical protein
MRSKVANYALETFDLMNNLLAARAIMISKVFKFIKLHLWVIFIISHPCLKTFDLKITLVANKSFMRSKVNNNVIFVLLFFLLLISRPFF